MSFWILLAFFSFYKKSCVTIKGLPPLPVLVKADLSGTVFNGAGEVTLLPSLVAI